MKTREEASRKWWKFFYSGMSGHRVNHDALKEIPLVASQAFLAGCEWLESQAQKEIAEKDKQLQDAKELIKEMCDVLKELNGHASASLLFPHKDKMDLCKAQFKTDRFLERNADKIKSLLGEE